MNVIKVNHNNASVKLPKKILPSVFFYKTKFDEETGDPIPPTILIEIKSGLNAEPFYTNYNFEVSIDGEVVGYITEYSSQIISLENNPNYYKEYFEVTINGYYYNSSGNKYEFTTTLKVNNVLRCSETVFCSERITVNDLAYGYYQGGSFYSSRELINNETVYTNEITDHDIGKYYDLISNSIYKWDIETQTYILI